MKLLTQMIQVPNPPLIVWFVSEIVSIVDKGIIHKVGAATSILALAIWAYLELTSGINLFRKILGGIVLLFTVYSLYMQLR